MPDVRSPAGAEIPRPTSLLVVGAVSGIGRWLCDVVFSSAQWDSVVLLDSDATVHEQVWSFGNKVITCHVEDATERVVRDQFGNRVDLAVRNMAVCLSVPDGRLQSVSAWLLPLLADDVVIFETNAAKVAALASLHVSREDLAVFGLHPLVHPDVGAIDGQTVVICASKVQPLAHLWLDELVSEAGGVVRYMTAEDHDQRMSYVQTLPHQLLMMFVDALEGSGLDIELDLWGVRTPLFETLLGLASRVLSESQQTTIALIQLANDGRRVNYEIAGAGSNVGKVVRGSHQDVENHIAHLREPFSGSFASRLMTIGGSAIGAAQSNRADLGRHRRLGERVGFTTRSKPGILRVGIVEELGPSEVIISEILAGSEGEGYLVRGPDYLPKNLTRIGRSREPVLSRFRLPNLTILGDSELERRLDSWLTWIPVVLRFEISAPVSLELVRTLVSAVPDFAVSDVVDSSYEEFVRFTVNGEIRSDRNYDVIVEQVKGTVDSFVATAQ